MKIIDKKKLTDLELKLYDILFQEEHFEKSIFTLASLAGASASKVSKFIRKLGFTNLKEFREYLKRGETKSEKSNVEVERIINFCNSFSESVLADTIKLLSSYNKIVFYGQGASFLCVNYFVNRFRIASRKNYIATDDKNLLAAELDSKTLFILVSASGIYYDIQGILDLAHSLNSKTFLILDERHPEKLFKASKTLYLTNTVQTIENESLTQIKSRSLFFIFFEVLVQALLKGNENKN